MNQLLIKIIYFYKKVISPYLGSQCRYSPSCSSYALDALREYSLELLNVILYFQEIMTP